MKIIVCLFSTVIDVLLLNILRFDSSNITFCYPMFTITCISYLSCFYNTANRKNYYFIVLISAIIYDTFAVGNLLISIFCFELIAFINIKMRKNFQNNLFNSIIRLLISIFSYDFTFVCLLYIVDYKTFSINLLFYKYFNSIFLNVLYLIIIFFVLKNKKA